MSEERCSGPEVAAEALRLGICQMLSSLESCCWGSRIAAADPVWRVFKERTATKSACIGSGPRMETLGFTCRSPGLSRAWMGNFRRLGAITVQKRKRVTAFSWAWWSGVQSWLTQ